MRGNAFVDQLRAAIHQARLVGAEFHGLARDFVVVRFVGLAEVGGIGEGRAPFCFIHNSAALVSRPPRTRCRPFPLWAGFSGSCSSNFQSAGCVWRTHIKLRAEGHPFHRSGSGSLQLAPAHVAAAPFRSQPIARPGEPRQRGVDRVRRSAVSTASGRSGHETARSRETSQAGDDHVGEEMSAKDDAQPPVGTPKIVAPV